MSDYTERFTNKAENYNTYRPKYPEELRQILLEGIKLTPEKLVADIGSGTGISSEIFLDLGNMVFGIEPNRDMREMAERNFDLEENFVSVNATAEYTGLHDKSIDFIFAGTAFHWFHPEKTKKEFARILKPGGTVMIAWIARDMDDRLQQKTEEVFDKFTQEIEATEKQKDGYRLEEFFAPEKINHRTIEHSQSLEWEGFFGRVSSSSYYPYEQDENYEEMMAEMRKVFDEFEKDGSIDFKYKTEIYWA